MVKFSLALLGQIAAATIGIPAGLMFWVGVVGPPPLEVSEMALVGHPNGIVRGETVSFTTKSFKPPWSARFCTATSASMTMIDAQNVIRQSAIISNWNDGSFRGATIPDVMITTGTAPGVERFQTVTVYECFGFSRTVRSPWVAAPILDP